MRMAPALLAAALVLAACGGEDKEARPASSSEDPALAAEEVDFATLMTTANPDRGRRLYIQCRACHTLVAGGNQALGPNLRGFLDRPAGTTPGYEYSVALLTAELTWTPETLDRWMRSPSEVIPGNKMIFAGIRKARDRADLVAWLQQSTVDE